VVEIKGGSVQCHVSKLLDEGRFGQEIKLSDVIPVHARVAPRVARHLVDKFSTLGRCSIAAFDDDIRNGRC